MTEMSPPIHIINHEKVVAAFGYWPLFHDAEVRLLKLDRNRTLAGATANPCIELVIHALEWTEVKGTAQSSFNHHLVHLECEEVDDVRLAGFNHQNSLQGLRIEPAEADASGVTRHWLGLNAANGLSGSFTYARAAVTAVTPCSDQGAPRW